MLVAIDYFIKWVEAVLLKTMNQKSVIEFITKHNIHRFRISESITTDQSAMFTREEIQAFAQNYKIKLLHSSPYCAQGNGQAKPTNKLIKMVIQKSIKENPRIWHENLSEVL